MFAFLPIFLFGFSVDGHIPLHIEPATQAEVIVVAKPEMRTTYYGELSNHPHTYEISSEHAFDLYVEILEPDINASERIISGIIVREVEGTGRVTEVARLNAERANWEPRTEYVTGDTYVIGSSYHSFVPAGVYRVEVNTPDNIGKYALVIGRKEQSGSVGYIEAIRRVAEVKVFFGKSQFRIVESPIVYVPLILMFAGIALWRYRRKARTNVL